ncbi:heat shock factor protein isoform X1 [Alosa sapidissima]|uniref:heat shock factor protein isoform X1 n=1 Tax=Alosa sapidissima TaxID=34773 RepID=UPI001C09A278|nr:heat shock factor protein isoform X1 [Alosa sapidissima]
MKQNSPVPAFLSKLWTLLEEQSTNDLIRWSQDGCSFLVLDEPRFSKEVLPLYFKHSNMTSFVRQLNMYGFHKVVHVDSGLPRDTEHTQSVEFQHPYFQRSQEHLLGLIHRKVSVSRVTEDSGQMSQVLVEVSQVQRWCDSSHLKLVSLCRNNASLGEEVDLLQQKYQHQHQIIRKIIHFITNTVQSSRIKGTKRKLPMIDSSGESSPAPKFRRSVSVQANRSHSYMDSIDGVYSNRVILSDIMHVLPPHSKLQSSLSVSVEIPSSFADDLHTSSNVASLPTEVPHMFSEVPSGSTEVPSKSKEMASVFTAVPSVSPSIPSQYAEMFSDVPCQSTTVPSLSKDFSSMFSEVPPGFTSFTSRSVDSVPSLCTDISAMFSEFLSAEIPPMFSKVPSAATSAPSVSAEIPSVFPKVPSCSTSVPSESAELTSVEQALSLLMEPETHNPIENHAKRCEDDPLDLIDSSLAAISCSVAPSDGLDLLSVFLGPVEDAPDHSSTSSQIAERKLGALPREETTHHTRTVSEAVPMAALVGYCGDEDDNDEDVGEGSDILPSLLQLAQEASALSMPISVPHAPCVPTSHAL